MSQVVVNIPPGSGQESQFGTLMLSLQKYPISMQTWSTTFFRLDGQPGPFLLVRADNIASELKTRPLAVALSFFKFNSGGLFVIFIRVQDDSLLPRLKARLPDLQMVAIEGAMGLDDPDQVKRISDALQSDQLHIVVAGNSSSTMESFDPSSGRSVQSSAPQAEFDIKVVIPGDVRETLQEELRALLTHHGSIPSPRRNWNTIQQDYDNAMPLSAEPILKKRWHPPQSPRRLRPKTGCPGAGLTKPAIRNREQELVDVLEIGRANNRVLPTRCPPPAPSGDAGRSATKQVNDTT